MALLIILYLAEGARPMASQRRLSQEKLDSSRGDTSGSKKYKFLKLIK
jgi:hypothetical protein